MDTRLCPLARKVLISICSMPSARPGRWSVLGQLMRLRLPIFSRNRLTQLLCSFLFCRCVVPFGAAFLLVILSTVYFAAVAAGEDMDRMQEILDRLDKLNNMAIDMDVTLLDKKIDQMLPELGFSPEDNDRLVLSYSGGWQMRMCLGKILLQVRLPEHLVPLRCVAAPFVAQRPQP